MGIQGARPCPEEGRDRAGWRMQPFRTHISQNAVQRVIIRKPLAGSQCLKSRGWMGKLRLDIKTGVMACWWDGMGENCPHKRRMNGKNMAPWLGPIHFQDGGGAETWSLQLHSRGLKSPQPHLSRTWHREVAVGPAPSSLRLPACRHSHHPVPGGKAVRSLVAPGAKEFWDVICIPADLKHDRGFAQEVKTSENVGARGNLIKAGGC